MKFHASPIALAAVVATLTACGGGGGETPQIDFTTKYAGTWESGCYVSSIVKDVSGSNTHVKDGIVLTRVNENNMTAAYAITVFAASDTNCAATPIGSIESTGLIGPSYTAGADGIKSSNGLNRIKVDGTATIGDKQVEQITLDFPPLTSSPSGNTVVLAGKIAINLGDFQNGKRMNVIFLSENTFTLGKASATAFPTALGTGNESIFTKKAQPSAASPSAPSSSPTN